MAKMMLLAIMSYPGGNDALKRHWPYFLKSGADHIIGIGPLEGRTWFPRRTDVFHVGRDSYIAGPELPQRLISVLKRCSSFHFDFDYIMVAEYDTVFFNPIDVSKMRHFLASHLAGGQTWNSKAKAFYHNPWVFKRSCIESFIEFGQAAIDDGVCGHPTDPQLRKAENSPDVFFGYVAQELGLEVETDLWWEFSRNDLKTPEQLEAARVAYHSGVDVIHGIKTQNELEIIMGGVAI